MQERTPVGEAILEAKSVKHWLTQFHKDDRSTAETLLCSLRLIGSSQYDEALMRLIMRLVVKSRVPVALFATRELAEGADYFDNEGRPTPLSPGQEIGSEGATAFLLTRLSRTDHRLLIEPTIEKMRAHRC